MLCKVRVAVPTVRLELTIGGDVVAEQELVGEATLEQFNETVALDEEGTPTTAEPDPGPEL